MLVKRCIDGTLGQGTFPARNDQIDAAKQAYAQCIYMACGRAWDPNGWFWSPAEVCAKFGRELVDQLLCSPATKQLN